MLGQLIGFLLGVVGSIAVWWVFAHLLVPSIRFEDRIVLRPGRAPGAPPRHMIKVRNIGRRDLIDVTFSAIVKIQIDPASDRRWASCRVAFHKTGEIDHQIPLIPARRNRLLTLYPGHSDHIRHEACFSEETRLAVADQSLDLETLLRDGEGRGLQVTLQVFMFGFDRFSGARKLFQSKQYEACDVEPGAVRGDETS
jgi:hypothetical protein